MMSSAYLRLLIFLLEILIPACNFFSPAFHMICSVYKLNKQGDNKQPYPTPSSILTESVVSYSVLMVASWPAHRFLTRQVRWSGIPISLTAFHKLPLWLGWLRIHLQCGRPQFSPWAGKIPWRRERLPLQYSGLENSMDCITHGVTKTQTWLSDFPSHIHIHVYEAIWSSLVAQMVKNLPALWETWVQSLGKEDPLEEEMANHSSILPRESMDRGAWWVIVHGVANSWAWLSH